MTEAMYAFTIYVPHFKTASLLLSDDNAPAHHHLFLSIWKSQSNQTPMKSPSFQPLQDCRLALTYLFKWGRRGPPTYLSYLGFTCVTAFHSHFQCRSFWFRAGCPILLRWRRPDAKFAHPRSREMTLEISNFLSNESRHRTYWRSDPKQF